MSTSNTPTAFSRRTSSRVRALVAPLPLTVEKASIGVSESISNSTLAGLLVECDRSITEFRRLSERLLFVAFVSKRDNAINQIHRLREIGAEASHLLRELLNSTHDQVGN